MKYMWMILFLALPLLALVYILWHVWQLLPSMLWLRVAAAAVCTVPFVLLPLTLTCAIDRWPLPLASAAYNISTTGLFVLIYAVMAFLLLDIGRLAGIVPKAWLHHNGAVAAVLTYLLVAVFVAGNVHYNNKVRRTLTLTTGKQLQRPLRIVMLSDLHIGYHNRRAELERWVATINRERPDMVLMAGDLIDQSMRPLIEEDMAAALRRIEAPVYACMGNHENLSDPEAATRFYADAHITLLRDSVAMVGGVTIIGREDRSRVGRKSLAELVKGIDRNRYTIVLDHQPYHLERAEQAGVDFQLSGHTHRGQIWPISWITDAVYECSYGEWQRGRTRYYVSSGLGIWGGRYRIGTCSEYVVATLE